MNLVNTSDSQRHLVPCTAAGISTCTALIIVIILLVCIGCSQATNSKEAVDVHFNLPADYDQQITAWRAAQEERLTSPTGWLALIDHHWLDDGPNTFGTDATNDLVLPADLEVAPHGTFVVKGGTVLLETDEVSGVLVNGEPVTSAPLTIDSLLPESDCEDQITIGDRLQLQLVRRADRFAVRVRDKESPAIREFRGKHWYPIKPEYRVVAAFTPYDPPKSISIVNVKGQVVPSKLSGRLDFVLDGRPMTLDALADSPDELFIVFKDKTSGDTTYPSGRFVVTELPVDGRVVLDFNKSYNPPCAFTPHALCPLPPDQNVLDVAIEAGELKYH